jgi:hypothetical protein
MPRWLIVALVVLGGAWLFIAAFGFVILKLF